MITVYLGDGLYAEFDGEQVCLYAFNGLERTDQVFMEPTVLEAFVKVFLPQIGYKP